MAKRYQFRFETLLRLRKQREDEEKRVVASRLRGLKRLYDHQVVLREQILEQTDTLRTVLREPLLDVDAVCVDRHCIARLRRGILEDEAEISTNLALLSQERAVLTNARKETKILERLKERQRAAYQAELDRREQIEQDDMNVTRYAYAIMAEGGAAV
ncbi:flagellar FliJ family protein [bacterium]|nr:flagellar FliJ family protein [bacterium]